MNWSETLHCLAMLLTVCVCWGSPPPSLCNPNDRDSLLGFIELRPLSDFRWDNKTDCCSWPGVGCDAATGRVIRLDLSNGRLVSTAGSFSNLYQLSHLQYLNLSATGPFISTRVELISKGIEKLEELTVLDISNTGLSSIIPTTIGNLRKLRVLNLADNDLQGRIPESLGNLSNLYRLDLRHNGLRGTIPKSLGNLGSLTQLDLSHNSLKGVIPDSLGNLVSLSQLDLSENFLKGNIPFSFVNLTRLVTLDLSYIQFKGTLPASLFNLSSLEFLHLSGCNFEGPLPTNIRIDSKLSSLMLNSNKLSGKIPSWVFNRALSILDLHYNMFTGIDAFPKPNVTFLSEVDLSFNQMRGPIPAIIFQLHNITILNFVGNEFSGALEWSTLKNMVALKWFLASDNRELNLKNSMNELFNLLSLESIQLNNCGITEFPIFLRNLQNLSDLLLRNNTMRGPINLEDGWNNLHNLDASLNMLEGSLPIILPPMVSILDLSHNNLTGEISSAYTHFYRLDLSHNSLSGVIPWINISQNNGVLDLSSNNLSGTIPSIPSIPLGRVFSVNLKFSNNKLSGEIPKSLGEYYSFSVLDLSLNNLSGRIPENLVQYGSDSFIGNKGLCGPPLTPQC